MPTNLADDDAALSYFDTSDNTLIGELPHLVNSRIMFADNSQNNVLVCEPDVSLVDSFLRFNGSNSVIYIGGPNKNLRLDVTVWGASSFAIGGGAYTNGALHAIASERRTIAIGSQALISFGIWIRTADPHLVYSAKSKQRINPSKDVLIGDHVWLGQEAMLLKGTTVGSGGIIGAHAVVAGKTIPSNTSWAGNPARQIARDVFFDSASVHAYSESATKKSMSYSSDQWVYTGANTHFNSLIQLAHELEIAGEDALKKADLLRNVFCNRSDKNRFALKASDDHGRRIGVLHRVRSRTTLKKSLRS